MAATTRRLTGTALFIRSRMGEDAVKSLFSDIWNHYYPRLRLFIRRMLDQSEDVDDAIQEVMLKVYGNLTAYRPSHAVSTWIYTIARNHCLDRIRREQVRIRVVSGGGDLDFESPYPTPEDALLRSESRSLAKALVQSLSPEEQQLAFLRFYEEMPFKQISSVMGAPVGTLKYRIHVIRRKMRERRADCDG